MKERIKKHEARKEPSVKPKTLMKKGDWIDALDADGVWNVARVLSVPSPDQVEITYDGWPSDYDEVVSITSHRVAPYNTFTWTVKCWVKYLNWPLWPSVVTIRSPGTTVGITNLAAENRLFVDFLDHPSLAKRDRCWQKKAHVRPFEENFDRKRTGSTGESFERALGWVLQSDASLKMPKFAGGTLPREFKHCPAKSVEAIRRDMGDKLWLKNLTHSKKHHQMNYVYESIGCKTNDRLRKNSMPSTQKESFLNLSATNVEPQVVTNEEKRPSRIKKDQNPRIEKEMPHKRELMDSSDASDTSWSKRTRLHTKRESDGLSNTKKTERKELGRSVSPHMSKTSKSAAQLAVKNAKMNHSKGRTKVAARQRVLPIGEYASVELSDDNSEVGEAQSVSVVPQLDTVIKRSAAAKRKKRPRKNDLNVDSDHSIELETSKMVSIRSKTTIKRQSADSKEKKIAVGCGQHLAAEKVSRHERIGLNGRSLSQTTLHGIIQPISPCVSEMESHQSRSSDLDVSRRAGKVHISLDARYKPIQETGSIREADSKDSAVVESCEIHHSTLLDADKHSTHEDGCSQELRRRFCVMQADQEDATETVKCSKKTVISVPRMFKEISTPEVPTCWTDGMVGIAPSSRLCTFASSVETGAAVAAPSSTVVFSSSIGFSMESWFKRKLMTECIGGET
ncbi:unnamed protein product [Peronospora farinosa]|uniref:PWWP domain-containing protein n=1 Tax=Peronospora farinosa TaxID=134698 RepID=A0ABN8C975_9STRA|nr:unnamed protein product [Peronospora farinosa]